MDSLAILFSIVAAALSVRALLGAENRLILGSLRRPEWLVFGLLGPAGVLVSLFHFSAIDNHAWRPHEESLWHAFRGDGDADGVPDSEDSDMDGDGTPNVDDPLNESYHPLETQILIRQIYTAVGALVGAVPEGSNRPGASSWEELKHPFMATALLLGMWGATLLGLAGRLLTGRFLVGFGAGLLLVFHPSLAYWRVNAFHVAVSQVVFCATLLAAVLVARRQSRWNYALWFVLGALSLFLRSEQAGAVVATALIPLLCCGLFSSEGSWRPLDDVPPIAEAAKARLKDFRTWLPGLIVAACLLAPPTAMSLDLAAQREDYRTGLRFLPLHLGVPEVFEPIIWPGILVLLFLALVLGSRAEARLLRPIVALLGVSILGLFPPLFFTSFGARHVLNSSSVAAVIALLGLVLVGEQLRPRLPTSARSTLIVLLALATIGPTIGASWLKLEAWGLRYVIHEAAPPAIPGTPLPPDSPPVFDPVSCGTYTGDWQLCNEEVWPTCHPEKDLRDPELVRQRWDRHEGCIIWGVGERDAEVAGVRHESWMIVSRLYRWEPLGQIGLTTYGVSPTGMDGEDVQHRVDVYRLAERP